MKTQKWRDAMKTKKHSNQYMKAKELGLPKPETSQFALDSLRERMKTFRHTEETKQKISKIRKEYLLLNPDKVPYKLNHYSKGKSYAEQYWKEVLDNNKIKYVEEYQIGLYSLDFAILDNKIDLEIDGDQHHLDDRIVESDKRRNEYLENLGWKIIRIRWSDYKKLKDKEDYVNDIIKLLESM